MKIIAKNIHKNFNKRLVLRDISFELNDVDSLVITGPNGSGKTTLVKIICGLLSPNKGSIDFFDDKYALERDTANRHIGLVSPYLQLYKDLTAWENLSFFAKARHGKIDKNRIFDLLRLVGLKNREHDALKTYSSGMLQRIKYVAALYHLPRVLVLDEPTANLDEAGKQIVHNIIKEQKKDKILIIATNEAEEIAFAAQRVEIV